MLGSITRLIFQPSTHKLAKFSKEHAETQVMASCKIYVSNKVSFLFTWHRRLLLFLPRIPTFLTGPRAGLGPQRKSETLIPAFQGRPEASDFKHKLNRVIPRPRNTIEGPHHLEHNRRRDCLSNCLPTRKHKRAQTSQLDILWSGVPFFALEPEVWSLIWPGLPKRMRLC